MIGDLTFIVIGGMLSLCRLWAVYIVTPWNFCERRHEKCVKFRRELTLGKSNLRTTYAQWSDPRWFNAEKSLLEDEDRSLGIFSSLFVPWNVTEIRWCEHSCETFVERCDCKIDFDVLDWFKLVLNMSTTSDMQVVFNFRCVWNVRSVFVNWFCKKWKPCQEIHGFLVLGALFNNVNRYHICKSK